MSINPVWVREMRSRWRGWRAYALLLAYVALLAGVLVWRYDDFLKNYGIQEVKDPLQRMSLLGHDLFAVLICLQAALWMLIAPILTATSITNERERGLLEGLQLSRLTTGQIVVGKLLSALSFIFLLIVVTLPIEAVCFLMGGISPQEFLTALLLHIAVAVTCATIGLTVSAWCRNSLAAMVLALVIVAAWLIASYICLAVIYNSFRTTTPWYITPLGLFSNTNPILAAYVIVEPDALGSGGVTLPLDFIPAWIECVGACVLSTPPLLWIAAVGTRRPSRDPLRIEWQQVRRELEKQDTAEQKRDRKARRFELGVLARLRFANPILGREVRACFRPRSSSVVMVILAAILAPLAVVAYVQGMYWVLFDTDMREIIGPSLLVIYLVMTILLCAILSAGAFAREREQSTLTALRLSLLSPHELLIGKMGSPLVICMVCGLVFFPILLPCVRRFVCVGSGSSMGGLSLTQLLGSLLLVMATAWCITFVGLAFSWFNRRVVSAACWTMSVLFALLAGVPTLLYTLPSYENQRMVTEFMRWWHPVVAILVLFNRHRDYGYNEYRLSTLADAASSSLVLFLIGLTSLIILYRAVLRAQNSD